MRTIQSRDCSRLCNEFVNLTHDVFRRHQLKVVHVFGHANDVLGEFSSEDTFVKVVKSQSG